VIGTGGAAQAATKSRVAAASPNLIDERITPLYTLS